MSNGNVAPMAVVGISSRTDAIPRRVTFKARGCVTSRSSGASWSGIRGNRTTRPRPQAAITVSSSA